MHQTIFETYAKVINIESVNGDKGDHLILRIKYS